MVLMLMVVVVVVLGITCNWGLGFCDNERATLTCVVRAQKSDKTAPACDI